MIAGITNFWANSFIFSSSCTDEIDSICGKIFWKGHLEGKCTAKVAWDKITTPKDEGGLGIKALPLWNTACALKLIWLLFFNQSSIWASWYIDEVLDGDINNFWVINTKQKNSWLANELIRLRDLAYPWIKLKVGNGETTYFWTGNWSPFGNIKVYLSSERLAPSGIPQDTTLAELWDQNHWLLPSARSEWQVIIQSYMSNLTISHS